MNVPISQPPSICLHGVCLAVQPRGCAQSYGVLIRGEAGMGKSHTALALLDRGHCLVADDAVILEHQGDAGIVASCPPALLDLMEIRGLGLINLRATLGDAAICPEHSLNLMINLETTAPSTFDLDDASEQRLRGHWRVETLFDRPIAALTLRAQSPSMLALLVEMAVRHFDARHGNV